MSGVSGVTPPTPPEPRAVMILAVNYQRAELIAREQGLRRGEWWFARDMADVRGRSGPHASALVAESFYTETPLRAQQDEMLAYLESHGITSSYVDGR